MITFTCDACAKSFGVPERYAGRRVRCPGCGEAARVPALDADADASISLADDPAQDDSLDTSAADPAPADAALRAMPEATTPAAGAAGGACPSCGHAYNTGAKICIKCGRHLATGVNAKTIAAGKKAGTLAGKAGLAIAASGAAAIVGGVVWALVAVKAGFEVGYLAWGIGALAGMGIVAFTKERSARLGVAAVAFALLGLGIGKVLTAQWMVSLASDNEIEDVIEHHPDVVLDAVVYEMVESRAFPADIQAEIDALPDMNAASDELLTRMQAPFVARLTVITEADKRNAVRGYLQAVMNELSFEEQLAETLAPHDILWTILAVASAWGLATRGGEEAT